MIKKMLLATSFGVLLSAGCGGAGSDTDALSQANRSGTNDSGTRLRGDGSGGTVVCAASGGSGTVAFSGTLTTTGSVDSAIITASVDGGAESEVGVINPQDFQKGGREKTAAYSVSVTVPDGSSTVTLCFTQSGSQGRYPKRTCTDAAVTIDCPTPTPPMPPMPPGPPAPPSPTPGGTPGMTPGAAPTPQPIPEIILG